MKILRKIYYYISEIYFKIIFFIFINNNSKKDKILIVDLDNTLANTWVSFNYKYKNDYQRYLSLAIFFNIRKIILFLIKKGFKVIFLSARAPKYYFVTLKWIKQNNIPVNLENIILVNKVKTKLYFLKIINKMDFKNVIYIDDLSYNHENGKIKKYIEIINEVKKLKLRYIDYENINQIIEKNSTLDNITFPN